MPVVTALRAEGRAGVAVELDGRPWRTLPLEPAVRAGLAPGTPLDRSRARILAREVRRHRALETAGRALRRRDLTEQALARRLEDAGVSPAERRAALETLARSGVVDDRRLAAGRAELLAERGYGDRAIRWDLERRGVAVEALEEALTGLTPERERATAIAAAAQGKPPAKTARLLARRGFGEEAIEAALASTGADESAQLG